jgi:hypothetical protein
MNPDGFFAVFLDLQGDIDVDLLEAAAVEYWKGFVAELPLVVGYLNLGDGVDLQDRDHLDPCSYRDRAYLPRSPPLHLPNPSLVRIHLAVQKPQQPLRSVLPLLHRPDPELPEV